MARTRYRWFWLAVITVVALDAATVAAQRAEFRDWRPSVLPDAAKAAPRVACADLVSLTGYDLSIISATVVPGTGDTPEYCRVVGQIQPEIRFEVSLPAIWNGHLYMFGNGGYAGEALDAPGRVAVARRALARGFAVTQTNTGHDSAVEPLGTFAVNSQKLLDYAYRAVHVTAISAKRMLQAYYESPLRHSYFDGCSTGGRQGLMSAQRFPEDFDGILAGAPVLNFTATMISYAAYQRALIAAPITPAQATRVAEAAYGKCDAIDGVSDGVIDDPRRCTFTPSADLPRCASSGNAAASCFSDAQIAALDTIYRAVRRAGVDVAPGWPVGAEAATPAGPAAPARSAWVPWFVAPATARPVQTNFAETFFRYMAFGKPTPSYDWLSFDLDADFDKLAFARTVLDATNPDLSRFKTRGGKILGYFGWADPALNPRMGIDYYERVTQTIGQSTPDFFRLFMVPGMLHCGGGVGVNTFDAFTALTDWVENGKAPQSIAASRVVDGKAVRTRPLCPHPQVARYKGSGSTDEASNFSCVVP